MRGSEGELTLTEAPSTRSVRAELGGMLSGVWQSEEVGGLGRKGGDQSDFGIVVFMFIFNLLYIAFFGVGLS